MNAEIPAFSTVEHRILLHMELQVTKPFGFDKRLKLNNQITHDSLPSSCFLQKSELLLLIGPCCFFTIIATHGPLQASPLEEVLE